MKNKIIITWTNDDHFTDPYMSPGFKELNLPWDQVV